MMKKKSLILILIALLCLGLNGCSSGAVTVDKSAATKVVFNLEGGQYLNSEQPIVYYYAFKQNTENLIKDPAAKDENDRLNRNGTVTKEGYFFDCWSKQKPKNGDDVSDGEKWNFESDRVKSGEAIELYASWKKMIKVAYAIYYTDELGAEKRVGYEDVESGDKVTEHLIWQAKNGRPGWTYDGLYSDKELSTPWDMDFCHPGAVTDESGKDADNVIKIYAKYTKGEFVEVRTADELIRNKNKDIRLMNDIDMSDVAAETFVGSFSDYKKIFDGNGKKIKNLKMQYSQKDSMLYDGAAIDGSSDINILGISLFGNAKNATIKNVTFENISVEIVVSNSKIKRVIVAPLFIKAQNVTAENVTFTGSYKTVSVPQSVITAGNLEIETVNAYYNKDDKSVIDVRVNFTREI